MALEVLIPLIFGGLFLAVDVALFIRVLSLLKKSKDDTAEGMGNKVTPFLNATAVVSVLMAICMILVTIMR